MEERMAETIRCPNCGCLQFEYIEQTIAHYLHPQVCGNQIVIGQEPDSLWETGKPGNLLCAECTQRFPIPEGFEIAVKKCSDEES